MALHLSSPLRAALADAARHGAPYEVCGLLGGTQRGQTFYAQRHAPIPNVAATPQVRFAMDHAAMVSAIFAFQRAHSELIGIYHSHPHSAPIPSHTDLAECAWQRVPYLIIGYAATQPCLAAWLIEGLTFTHLPLI
jgi:proteasome lid subunit RPN8/RPN11